MSSGEQEQRQQRSRAERQQLEALYGPVGRGDHRQGETISFANQDTRGQQLSGKIVYIRAPGPAIVGGRSHPACYIVYVAGESFIRVVYPGDVIIEGKTHKNGSS